MPIRILKKDKSKKDTFIEGSKVAASKLKNTDANEGFKTDKKTKSAKDLFLTGGQAKLDKNKNNKIDAEDFKILKAEKAKNRGKGLQDEKMKPGKVMKARMGKSMKKDPTKPVNPFEKKSSKFIERRKKFGGVKSLIGKGGRIGAAAAMLGLAGAGAAKIGQTIGKKIDEAKKKNKKMGGGMMKRPMGYTKGGGADTGRMGELRSKLGVASNKVKRTNEILKRIRPKLKAPDRKPMNPAKAMGGGMMMRPTNYKKGSMIKARGGGLARTKPTKMY